MTTTKVDLNSGEQVQGTLPVANGGTGATSLTSGALLVGGGSSAIAAASGSGYVKLSSGIYSTVGVPSDFMLVQFGQNTPRNVGYGDFTQGFYVGRAFTATSITYQFDVVDTSGSSTVNLYRNGAAIAATTMTITAANQADGTGTDAARTASFSQSFSVGDRIALYVSAAATTPGSGLRAWIVGTWN